MKQVRRGVRSPVRLSGKVNNNRFRFPDRLQNNSILPFHANATNRKKACISLGWEQEPIGKKLPLDFFVKIICATPTVYFFHQLFYSLIIMEPLAKG